MDELNLTLHLVMMVELLGEPRLDRVGAQELMKCIGTYKSAVAREKGKQPDQQVDKEAVDEFAKRMEAARNAEA